MKAAGWPPGTFFPPILAFFFLTDSHHPISLASSSRFFFDALASQNDFCLSFTCPVSRTSSSGVGHSVRWKETDFGMQPGLSAQLRDFLKRVRNGHRLWWSPSVGDGTHLFERRNVSVADSGWDVNQMAPALPRRQACDQSMQSRLTQ